MVVPFSENTMTSSVLELQEIKATQNNMYRSFFIFISLTPTEFQNSVGVLFKNKTKKPFRKIRNGLNRQIVIKNNICY